MFERYTEQSRRVIFFARYEAAEAGAAEIGVEHLLLGIARECQELLRAWGVLDVNEFSNSLRAQMDHAGKQGVATSVNIPLTRKAKEVLSFAMEAADRLHDARIAPEHLVIGILKAGGPSSVALETVGVSRIVVEDWIAGRTENRSAALAHAQAPLADGNIEYIDALSGRRVAVAPLVPSTALEKVGDVVEVSSRRYSVVRVKRYPEVFGGGEDANLRAACIVVRSLPEPDGGT